MSVSTETKEKFGKYSNQIVQMRSENIAINSDNQKLAQRFESLSQYNQELGDDLANMADVLSKVTVENDTKKRKLKQLLKERQKLEQKVKQKTEKLTSQKDFAFACRHLNELKDQKIYYIRAYGCLRDTQQVTNQQENNKDNDQEQNNPNIAKERIENMNKQLEEENHELELQIEKLKQLMNDQMTEEEKKENLRKCTEDVENQNNLLDQILEQNYRNNLELRNLIKATAPLNDQADDAAYDGSDFADDEDEALAAFISQKNLKKYESSRNGTTVSEPQTEKQESIKEENNPSSDSEKEKSKTSEKEESKVSSSSDSEKKKKTDKSSSEGEKKMKSTKLSNSEHSEKEENIREKKSESSDSKKEKEDSEHRESKTSSSSSEEKDSSSSGKESSKKKKSRKSSSSSKTESDHSKKDSEYEYYTSSSSSKEHELKTEETQVIQQDLIIHFNDAPTQISDDAFEDIVVDETSKKSKKKSKTSEKEEIKVKEREINTQNDKENDTEIKDKGDEDSQNKSKEPTISDENKTVKDLNEEENKNEKGNKENHENKEEEDSSDTDEKIETLMKKIEEKREEKEKLENEIADHSKYEFAHQFGAAASPSPDPINDLSLQRFNTCLVATQTDTVGASVDFHQELIQKQNEEIAKAEAIRKAYEAQTILITKYEEDIAKAKFRGNQLDTEINKAKTNLKQAQIAIQNDKVRQQNEEKQTQQLHTKAKKLKVQLKKRQGVFTNIQSRIAELEQQIDDLVEERSVLERDLKDLDARNRPEVVQLSQQVTQYRTRLDDSESKMNMMKNSVNDRRNKLKTMLGSQQTQSIKKLEFERFDIERKQQKWNLMMHSTTATMQVIENYSVRNSKKRKQLLSSYQKAEKKRSQKDEEEQMLEWYSQLLNNLIQEHNTNWKKF